MKTIFRKVLLTERKPDKCPGYYYVEDDKGGLGIELCKPNKEFFGGQGSIENIIYWLEEIELPSEENIITFLEEQGKPSVDTDEAWEYYRPYIAKGLLKWMLDYVFAVRQISVRKAENK